jgi:hypothetical protein
LAALVGALGGALLIAAAPAASIPSAIVTLEGDACVFNELISTSCNRGNEDVAIGARPVINQVSLTLRASCTAYAGQPEPGEPNLVAVYLARPSRAPDLWRPCSSEQPASAAGQTYIEEKVFKRELRRPRGAAHRL